MSRYCTVSWQTFFLYGSQITAQQLAQSYGFLATEIETVSQAQELQALTAQRVTGAAMDMAAALAKPGYVVGELVTTMGKAGLAGKYLAQDFMEMANRGVALTDILARSWGKTRGEILQMRNEGLLNANDVNMAIVEEWERLYSGAAVAAGETIAGRTSGFGDILSILRRETFASPVEYLSEELDKLNDTLQDPATVEAAQALGDTLNAGAHVAIEFAGGVATVADVVSDMAVPALIGAGTAATVGAAQWLAAGGAAHILATGLSNVASTAWAAQAAIRGITLASALPVAIAGKGSVAPQWEVMLDINSLNRAA